MFKNIFREWATPKQVSEKKDMSEMCCKNCGDMFGKPTKENRSCQYDAYNPEGKNWVEKMKEALDAVNKKELKGKHKDRKDKDIDNDGDVDSTDKYLHKRRKAISKAMKKGKDKEGDVEMNPKLEKGSNAATEQKESLTIREKLLSVLSEGDRAKHYKGATKPETMDDKLKGQGAKDMVNQPKEVDDTEEKGHDDASKAGRVTKPAKQRNGGDQVRSGDQKVVNPVKKMKEAYIDHRSDKIGPSNVGMTHTKAEKAHRDMAAKLASSHKRTDYHGNGHSVGDVIKMHKAAADQHAKALRAHNAGKHSQARNHAEKAKKHVTDVVNAHLKSVGDAKKHHQAGLDAAGHTYDAEKRSIASKEAQKNQREAYINPIEKIKETYLAMQKDKSEKE